MTTTSFGTTRRKKLHHAVLTKKYADGGIDSGLAPIHAIYTMLGYDSHPSPSSVRVPREQTGYKYTACHGEWKMTQQARLAQQQQQQQQQPRLANQSSTPTKEFSF
jgi:hypothetical protein